MLFKGIIGLTCDPNQLQNAILSGAKVVVMKDNMYDIGEYYGPDPIEASLLLPSYDAISAYLDNEYDICRKIYFDHLSQKEQDMYICAIMAALIKGINILLYIDKDMFEMNFAQLFYEFILNTYGIAMTSEIQPNYMYNENYDMVNVSKLYFYDFLTPEAMFMLYPAQAPIHESIIMKLIAEMNPYVTNDQGLQPYFEFFFKYKEDVKKNNNKPLTIPIRRTREIGGQLI